MGTVALYPGTFDPVTNGHLDLIQRSLEIFDYLIIGIAHNIRKAPLFSVEERLEMLREVTKEYDRTEVVHFDGLMVSYAKSRDVEVIVRGLRAVSDFEYELQMALMNRKLEDEIKTVFMMPSAEYSFLSSSFVKEICRLGGKISCLVPGFVETQLRQKFRIGGD